jgi:hypothetical protein
MTIINGSITQGDDRIVTDNESDAQGQGFANVLML